MEIRALIEKYKNEIVEKTQEIIRIRSVEGTPAEGKPFGEGPYKALEYAVNLSKEMGFKVEEFDGYAAHAEIGQGDELVGILVHLDVVPEGEGWEYDPYGGEVHDGKIYGRGAVDDKGPAIAVMYAMKILQDLGVDFNRRIRIIFGTNEESGWGCMNHYLSKVKPPTMAFTPDADFPVINGEKGIMVFDLKYPLKEDGEVKLIDLKGGSAPNMVPDTASVILELEDIDSLMERAKSYNGEDKIEINVEGKTIQIRAKGKSAHGSTPERGENAISNLMAFLGEVLKAGSLKEFARLYNESIGFYHNGEGIGCGFEDEISGKLNFNAGMIKYEDGYITLTINIRYPITSSAQEVYAGMREKLKDTDMVIVEGSDQKPLYVPEDNFLVTKLMDVYRSVTGDYDSKPIVIGGGTYARAMENAVAFGPVFPGQEDVVHQKNEYIAIDHLMMLTEIYTKALYELSR